MERSLERVPKAVFGDMPLGWCSSLVSRAVPRPPAFPPNAPTALQSVALANSWGCPAAHESPQGPPKSWSTKCARRIPSSVKAPARCRA